MDYYNVSRRFARKVVDSLLTLKKDPDWNAMLAKQVQGYIDDSVARHRRVRIPFDTSSDIIYELNQENTKDSILLVDEMIRRSSEDYHFDDMESAA